MLKKMSATLDPHFVQNCKQYIFQSLLGAVSILFFFFLSGKIENHLTVTSLGASTFIAFSFPKANASKPRYLIGGYITGCMAGLLCYFLYVLFLRYDLVFLAFSSKEVCCAAAFFVSMFAMAGLNFEHPPAVALSISIVVAERPFLTSVLAIAGIMLLCTVKRVLYPYLINLSA